MGSPQPSEYCCLAVYIVVRDRSIHPMLNSWRIECRWNTCTLNFPPFVSYENFQSPRLSNFVHWGEAEMAVCPIAMWNLVRVSSKRTDIDAASCNPCTVDPHIDTEVDVASNS